MKNKPYTIDASKFLDKDERKRILRTCKEKSELDLLKGRKTWIVRFMLIDLALYSGLRVAEMAALKISDIDLKNKTVLVRNGKGGKDRLVYIDSELVKHLKDFIWQKKHTLNEPVTPSDALFSGRSGHVPPITLMKSFKTAAKAANLPSHYSIHSCRHTYATYLLEDTENMRYVQKQLGHANISMTAIYADVSPEMNNKLADLVKRD